MKTKRAFTLLEVMVAMAILALGLTTILSSQTGLFATTRRVQNETVAASLVRCKMNELELKLDKDGYPLLDQSDSGPCCEDETGEFTCDWKIETVELPQPASFDLEGEGEEGALDEEAEDSSELDLSSDPSSALSSALPFAGTGVAGVEGVGDVAGVLGDSTDATGAQGGIVGMALGMVYPTLKPLLEASIRKLTVKVMWREGAKEKDFEVVQYVTNPMEGSLNPNADEGLDDMLDMLGQTGAGSGIDGTDAGDDSSGEVVP